MRLYKIEFNGYKRLAATSCNVDGRLIAFLGPNEAGKSSVLEGLDWLSSGDEELPQRLISRSVDVQSDEWVVKARFSLDEDDLAALSDLDVDGTYREFVASRDRDGTFRTGIYPRLTRKPRPFEVAIETLADCVKMAPNEFTFAESEDGQGNRVDRVQKLLSTPDASWSDEDADLVTSLMGWMDEQAEDDSKSPSMRATLVRALEAVTQARSVALQEYPTETARMRMGRRRPQFVLF